MSALRAARSRLLAHWRTKAALYVALSLAFCGPYFLLQAFPPRPPVRFEPSVVDEWVKFRPGWAWAYQSVYLLLPTGAAPATTRDQFRRYTTGFLILAGIGFACFAAFPVECPRPAGGPQNGMYGLLTSYDGTTNTFPSLHVALAAYTVLVGRHTLGPSAAGRAASGVQAGWAVVVAYSTLATKQHYAVDLPAGVLVAWVGYRAAWRGAVTTIGQR